VPHPSPALLLAVALDGAGHHPAAWRVREASGRELFTGQAWVDQVREAQAGGVDFVTIADALTLQSTDPGGPDDRIDQVRGRLDATMIAARVAPLTQGIGIVPEIGTSFSEPFHVSTALATLDFISGGRAGWLAAASGGVHEAATVGRPWSVDDPHADAADHVEVVRRLWDSWEDGAEIRDGATNRFIDRSKVHHIDFSGRRFTIRGPSITPRPPQGQLPVMAAARTAAEHQLAGRVADLVLLSPPSAGELGGLVHEALAAREAAGRAAGSLPVLADVVVFLDEQPGAARERLERLDALDGAPLRPATVLFTGTAAELADLVAGLAAEGATGVRLLPGAVPHDLEAITRALVPELRRRGLREPAPTSGTLRSRLGLPAPANRYAST
jgi:alkanesulfonate monooxygenase SsuD/methylene tetrahydromethanopterin reductase-like flavin-dependent oxidoreductase (luciferase family)